MKGPARLVPTLAAVLALCGMGAAYPTMAGSCEGVFSSAHSKSSRVVQKDGGWRIEVGAMSSWGGKKMARLSMRNDRGDGSGFVGFLLKSFDLETGAYIGSFSDLPLYTELYTGCPVPQAAVHHNERVYFDGGKNMLNVSVEWPSDRDLGFAFFPVAATDEWYEVYGSTTAAPPKHYLHNKALKENFFSTRLGKPAWVFLYLGFYIPILVLVFVGAVAKGTNGPEGLGAKLNHTVPLQKVPLLLQLSVGEWLSHGLYYAVQVVTLALMTMQIAAETEGLPSYVSDGQTWYPNPWDAYLARASGRLLQANLTLTLLLPTRNALWPYVVGISFERCIKYHRIVGRCTVINMIVHFVGMYLVYGTDALFLCDNGGTCRWGEGNLFGVLAGWSMILMALSAAEPVRRRSYELFLALHMMAFPTLIFAVLHVRNTLAHLILPIVLYLVDFALRLYQWMHSVKIISASALPGSEGSKGATHVRLHCPAVAQALWAKKAQGIGAFIYLQSPTISRNPMEWHPFSVSGFEWTGGKGVEQEQEMGTIPPTASLLNVPVGSRSSGYQPLQPHEGPPDGLSVHIKSMGKGTWTKRLWDVCAAKSPVTMRLEGAYGHMGVDLTKYSHIVSASGGIGFTPCGPLLQLVLDPARRQACFPLLRSLRVVWVAKTHAQFQWFGSLLTSAFSHVASPDFSLHVELYITGDVMEHRQFVASSGRPSWDEVCKRVATDSKGEPVAMLVCGPPALVSGATSSGRSAGFHTHIETFLL